MYEIIKSIIRTGNFRVNDITTKMDTFWAAGKLTDEEYQELNTMITDYITPETEAPQDYELLARQIAELKDTLSDVIDRVTALEGGEPEPEEPTGIIIPEWEPYNGISTDYQYGAVVTHNGKYWQNILEGMQNTWEPGSAGVDERYWKEITKEEAEKIITSSDNKAEELPLTDNSDLTL